MKYIPKISTELLGLIKFQGVWFIISFCANSYLLNLDYFPVKFNV